MEGYGIMDILQHNPDAVQIKKMTGDLMFINGSFDHFDSSWCCCGALRNDLEPTEG